MKISNRFSNWFLALIIVVLFSIAATVLLNNIQQQQVSENLNNKPSQHTLYGQDGKVDGQMLDTNPIRVEQDYIYFDDRVLKRYYYNSAEIEYTVSIMNALYDWVPDDVNKYFLAVPIRIAIESNIDTTDRFDCAKAIKHLLADLDVSVVKINTLENLFEHADEYIFFRTDKTWTALGAYYAAEEFLTTKGIDIIPIENYYDFFTIDYLGTLRSLDNAQSLYDYPDLVYSYTLKDSNNTQSITAYDNNEYMEYTSPVIATSRGGTDAFIGRYFSHTVIEGDVANGESIIIMGDRNSKIFAPWLIPYYNKIILINPLYYNGDADTIAKAIQEYTVSDFLIIESLSSFGESIYNQEISLLLTQQDKREEE